MGVELLHHRKQHQRNQIQRDDKRVKGGDEVGKQWLAKQQQYMTPQRRTMQQLQVISPRFTQQLANLFAKLHCKIELTLFGDK